MASEKKVTDRLPREAIARFDFPRLSPEILKRFEALEDLTGTVADCLGLVSLRDTILAQCSLQRCRANEWSGRRSRFLTDAVLAEALNIDAGDTRQRRDIAEGTDLATLAQTRYM